MPWLNWSLKFHVRLRTISHLIPPTSHMSMFNEYLIHLCDCTWLNVLYILNHMLIKHFFFFFEYFSCFGKCFVSKIFSKIQKFSTLSFGDSLVSHASHEAPIASLHIRFCDPLASETSSREKDLEKFFKILHKGFWQLILATCSQVIWVVKNACFAKIRLNLKQF